MFTFKLLIPDDDLWLTRYNVCSMQGLTAENARENISWDLKSTYLPCLNDSVKFKTHTLLVNLGKYIYIYIDIYIYIYICIYIY